MQEWIEVVSDMKEPFDYEEYLFRMKTRSGEPLRLDIYGQLVGMYLLARQRYPRLQPQASYIKFSEEWSAPRKAPRVKGSEPKQKAGGCGGCGN